MEKSAGKRDGTGAEGEETVKEGAEERDPGERRRWNLFFFLKEERIESENMEKQEEQEIRERRNQSIRKN